MANKEIMLGDSKFLVVDLTQPLRLDTEVYPGDPKPERSVFSDIAKTGWEHYTHRIGDHNFTPHIDAPNHQNQELQGKGVEVFGLDYCFNDAFLIDVSNALESETIMGVKYLIEIRKKHLEQYVKLFKQNGAVIIRTGYDIWLEENKPHEPKNLPYLHKDAAEFIALFPNIRVVGLDSLTVDAPGLHAAHQALKNTMIVESLVRLYNIPKGHRLNFSLQTSPIKIFGATGCPVLAYAYIKL